MTLVCRRRRVGESPLQGRASRSHTISLLTRHRHHRHHSPAGVTMTHGDDVPHGQHPSSHGDDARSAGMGEGMEEEEGGRQAGQASRSRQTDRQTKTDQPDEDRQTDRHRQKNKRVDRPGRNRSTIDQDKIKTSQAKTKTNL
jgi:hypothetical protein